MRPKEEKRDKKVFILLFLLFSLALVAITINCVASAWSTYILSS
jgi:predicted nucleic acid-binding Zn ribbon protein